MLKGEFNLLILDCLPEAKKIVYKRAAPNSLTEKILKGQFGAVTDKNWLFIKRARELAFMKAYF